MLPLRDSRRPRRFPIVNVALIVATGAVFLYQLSLTPQELQRFYGTFGVVPAAVHDPLALVLAGRIEILGTLVTAIFLHGGWVHFVGNMLYLWVFGDNVEDRLGHLNYLGFYLLGGVAAGYAQVYTAPASTVPLIGASGAIAAVLGAYLVFYPSARVLALVPLGFFITVTEIPALAFLAFWFLLQLGQGMASLGTTVGVAWWAHIGGFVFGLAVALWLWLVTRRRYDYG